jgi:two-component system cell cycle response regulator
MRVLVADDNPDSARAMAAMLSHWGYQPAVVHNGVEALNLLRGADGPTLAVLDWIMPGMNGVSVCRELRKDIDRPYIYVILVTGKGGKEDMLAGLSDCVDDYFVKPINPLELRARLSTANRILNLQDQLLATQRLLREQATRDSLTGLWNRPTILEILDRELARSFREQRDAAVVMADLDHFKRINDQFGHLGGDQVLRQIARRFVEELRPYDTVGRYGGEEFLIVLPKIEAPSALALAERLCRHVRSEPIMVDDTPVFVTVSLGVAVWDAKLTALELLRQADAALYRAKAGGRNCARASEVSVPSAAAATPA